MASIFTKIVNAEIPAYKIAEDDRFLAFLDLNPLTKGHNLVIPKQETDYLFDLDEDLFADLNRFAHKVAKAIKPAMNCTRVGVCVIGQDQFVRPGGVFEIIKNPLLLHQPGDEVEIRFAILDTVLPLLVFQFEIG